MSLNNDDKEYAGPQTTVSPAYEGLTDEELATTHEGDHGTRRDLVGAAALATHGE